MPVTPFVTDDKFVIRIRKYLTTNPDNRWVNSYEFRAVASGDEGDLLVLGLALVSYEQWIHYETVAFDSLLISTWAEDSKPYDPEAFISSPLTGIGLRVPDTEDLLGLSNCIDVRRFAATGRYGHIFYRGSLVESEVEAPAGKTLLTNRAAIQTIITDALDDTGMDTFLGPSAALLQMVMINATGTQVRPVISLNVGQVAQVKQDHRWFNRTSP